MADTVTLSFRVSAEKAERLAKLAKAMDRPRSWLLDRALDEYLDWEEYAVAEIQAGLKELDEGRFISHEKMVAWLDSLGTDYELPPPEPETRK
jgi:predicted transcriptional regulator